MHTYPSNGSECLKNILNLALNEWKSNCVKRARMRIRTSQSARLQWSQEGSTHSNLFNLVAYNIFAKKIFFFSLVVSSLAQLFAWWFMSDAKHLNARLGKSSSFNLHNIIIIAATLYYKTNYPGASAAAAVILPVNDGLHKYLVVKSVTLLLWSTTLDDQRRVF